MSNYFPRSLLDAFQNTHFQEMSNNLISQLNDKAQGIQDFLDSSPVHQEQNKLLGSQVDLPSFNAAGSNVGANSGFSPFGAQPQQDIMQAFQPQSFQEQPTGNQQVSPDQTVTQPEHNISSSSLDDPRFGPVDNSSPDSFKKTLLPYAQRASERTGIPASALVAIAANESGWGKFNAGGDSTNNNWFGVKGSQPGTWSKFDSPQEGIDWVADMISKSPRYADAMKNSSDPKAFIQKLADAGYIQPDEKNSWVSQVSNISDQIGSAANSPGVQASNVDRGSKYDVAFGFNQPYGDAQFNPDIPNHRGVDLIVSGAKDNGRGSPVEAFQPGVVESVTHDPNGGNGIIIKTPDGLYNRYFHFDSINVKPGDKISAGDNIGVLGASGTEGFPHVHFEVSKSSQGDPQNALIDPTPYMNNSKANSDLTSSSEEDPVVPLPQEQKQQNSSILNVGNTSSKLVDWLNQTSSNIQTSGDAILKTSSDIYNQKPEETIASLRSLQNNFAQVQNPALGPNDPTPLISNKNYANVAFFTTKIVTDVAESLVQEGSTLTSLVGKASEHGEVNPLEWGQTLVKGSLDLLNASQVPVTVLFGLGTQFLVDQGMPEPLANTAMLVGSLLHPGTILARKGINAYARGGLLGEGGIVQSSIPEAIKNIPSNLEDAKKYIAGKIQEVFEPKIVNAEFNPNKTPLEIAQTKNNQTLEAVSREHGGATVDPQTLEHYSGDKGNLVVPNTGGLDTLVVKERNGQIVSPKFKGQTIDDIAKKFVADNPDTFQGDTKLGLWKKDMPDGSTDWHFDANTTHESRGAADWQLFQNRAQNPKNTQLKIHDLSSGENIPINQSTVRAIDVSERFSPEKPTYTTSSGKQVNADSSLEVAQYDQYKKQIESGDIQSWDRAGKEFIMKYKIPDAQGNPTIEKTFTPDTQYVDKNGNLVLNEIKSDQFRGFVTNLAKEDSLGIVNPGELVKVDPSRFHFPADVRPPSDIYIKFTNDRALRLASDNPEAGVTSRDLRLESRYKDAESLRTDLNRLSEDATHVEQNGYTDSKGKFWPPFTNNSMQASLRGRILELQTLGKSKGWIPQDAPMPPVVLGGAPRDTPTGGFFNAAGLKSWSGGLAGFDPNQTDENGNPTVGFDPKMAVIGMAASKGIEHFGSVAARDAEIQARMQPRLRENTALPPGEPRKPTFENKAGMPGLSPEDLMSVNTARDATPPSLEPHLNQGVLPGVEPGTGKPPEGVTARDWVDAIRNSSLLSSPGTLLRNVASGVYQLPRKLLVDAMSQSPATTEAEVKGLVGGLGDAYKNALDTLRTGESSFAKDLASRRGFDASSTLAPRIDLANQPGLPGLLAKGMKFGSNALRAPDEFFHTLALKAELGRLSMVKGEALAKQFEVPVEDAVSHILAMNDKGTLEAAAKVADKITYRSPLESGWKSIQTGINNLPLGLGKEVAPFYHALVNIGATTVEELPVLGALRRDASLSKSQQAASQVVSLATAGAAVYMTAKGALSGDGPSDPEEKARLIRSGWMPNSFKTLDGAWHSYQGLGPLSTQLTAAANAYEVSQDKGLSEQDIAAHLGRFGQLFGKAMVGTLPIQGISDILTLTDTQSSDAQVENILSGYVVRRIPFGGAINSLSSAFDTRTRDPQGIGERVAQRIGPLRGNLPVKVDPLGQEIPNPGQGLNALSPFRANMQRANPADTELGRLGISVSTIDDKTIGTNKVPISREQQQELKTKAGTNLSVGVQDIMALPQYGKLSDEEKTNVLNKVKDVAAQEARNQIVAPELARKKPDGEPLKYYGVKDPIEENRIDLARAKVSQWQAGLAQGKKTPTPTGEEFRRANAFATTYQYKSYLAKKMGINLSMVGNEDFPFDSR